ncbi:MAG: hypothetical protein KDD69_02330 [Bdellovibrionales bacterium]|nr:hypothetical protein [Bdellovibrionales bacterium]
MKRSLAHNSLTLQLGSLTLLFGSMTLLFGGLVFVGLVSGCGGGGGGDGSGILFEGTLTQGSEETHQRLAHGANEPLEEVDVCALGECSRTDIEGRWGFVADDTFTGGPVEFHVVGHGIDSTWVLEVPHGSSSIMLELVNRTDGVHPESLMADGVAVEVEHTHVHDEDGSTEASHDHSHE